MSTETENPVKKTSHANTLKLSKIMSRVGGNGPETWNVAHMLGKQLTPEQFKQFGNWFIDAINLQKKLNGKMQS